MNYLTNRGRYEWIRWFIFHDNNDRGSFVKEQLLVPLRLFHHIACTYEHVLRCGRSVRGPILLEWDVDLYVAHFRRLRWGHRHQDLQYRLLRYQSRKRQNSSSSFSIGKSTRFRCYALNSAPLCEVIMLFRLFGTMEADVISFVLLWADLLKLEMVDV